MDKIVAADFESMNYEELELFEEIVGTIPSTEEELESVPRSRLMIALGFISGRRSNPDLTLEEVKKLPVGSIVFGEDEDDPS